MPLTEDMDTPIAAFQKVYNELAPVCSLPADLEEVFAAWYGLLWKWNQKTNLTRVIEPRRVVAYHLADAVPLARAIEPKTRLLDIGSGAGVPGLIVAALQPLAEITCVEASAKKSAFLVQAADAMGLKNVRVLHRRGEDLDDVFDVVTARALSRPDQLALRFGRLLSDTGRLACFTTADAATQIPPGFRLKQEISYTLPAGEGPRRLLFIVRKNNE